MIVLTMTEPGARIPALPPRSVRPVTEEGRLVMSRLRVALCAIGFVLLALLVHTGLGMQAGGGRSGGRVVPVVLPLPAGLHQPRCLGVGHSLALPFAAVAPAAGAVYEGAVVSAALHGRARAYEIYLPPGYSNPANAMRRYPVVYLLHGAPGGPTDWLCAGNAARMADEGIRAKRMMPLILVMPDGNGGRARDTQYVDKFNGRDNEMEYLANDVVHSIDAHYRTLADADHRALVGFSAGGYGAMNVGLHYPNVFHAIGSLSGYFVALRSEVYGANDPFGHGRAFRRANSPYDYVASVAGVRHLRLLIADTTANLPYTRYAVQFDARLTQLGIPHIFQLYPSSHLGHGHDWRFWAARLQSVLGVIEGSRSR